MYEYNLREPLPLAGRTEGLTTPLASQWVACLLVMPVIAQACLALNTSDFKSVALISSTPL